MKQPKNLAILGLSFLAAGYWCNLIALQAYIGWLPSSMLKVLGDILPFELSIGDCFLFLGYALFAILLGRWIGYKLGGLFLKFKKAK